MQERRLIKPGQKLRPVPTDADLTAEVRELDAT